jgi:hypothetical protein
LADGRQHRIVTIYFDTKTLFQKFDARLDLVRLCSWWEHLRWHWLPPGKY